MLSLLPIEDSVHKRKCWEHLSVCRTSLAWRCTIYERRLLVKDNPLPQTNNDVLIDTFNIIKFTIISWIYVSLVSTYAYKTILIMI